MSEFFYNSHRQIKSVSPLAVYLSFLLRNAIFLRWVCVIQFRSAPFLTVLMCIFSLVYRIYCIRGVLCDENFEKSECLINDLRLMF